MENKIFKISAENIKQLIDADIGCIASDMITVEGKKVGYMYREIPIDSYDSGWRFFSGDEDQYYADDAEKFSFYKINTIANYDPVIMAYIDMPIGSNFERKNGADKFILIEEAE